MAEVIKYGLLGNLGLYQKLLSMEFLLDAQSEELPVVIEACCMDKARIVELDEKETIDSTGGRALLNLGHTFAHAIEAVAGYGEYLHGEAVSIGLLCALRLSVLMGNCKESDQVQLEGLLNSYSLPTKLRSPLPVSDLKVAMHSDKKVSGGKLRFVAMKNIGDAFVTSEVDWGDVVKVWQSVGAD
jgi:3-dehydroquinate synthase